MVVVQDPHAGGGGRPGLERSNTGDGGPTGSRSNISTGMANAARRLSLFRLKNSDHIKLKPTGDGKGGLAKALADNPVGSPDLKRAGTAVTTETAETDSGRPNLVRRNTCGTLYVGTTMSAPDKDATIKVRTSTWN